MVLSREERSVADYQLILLLYILDLILISLHRLPVWKHHIKRHALSSRTVSGMSPNYQTERVASLRLLGM